MNENVILPDDPRLTAYALNEMEPAECAEFEQLLERQPDARRVVEELRETSRLLTNALEGEPAPVASEQKPKAAILRFPQFYYVVSGVAAACFALFFVVWQRNQPVQEKRFYQEVDLAALAKARQGVSAEKERVGQAPVAAPAPVQPKAKAMEEAVLVLSPFEKTTADANYTSAATVAGARANPELNGAGAMGGAVSTHFYADVRSRQADGYINDLNLSPKAAGVRMEVSALRPATAALPVDAAFSTEAYAYRTDNDYLRVKDQPLSTFSVDVDTASYANVRRFLTQGKRPPVDAVRIEELVNYFPYAYPQPAGDAPFAASLEVASTPWAPEHRLVRIGLKGREVSEAARPAANLVFLLDVSGSMQSPNKLPLVKQSLRLLMDKLRSDDRVAIAVYAGSSGLALPSTPVSRKAEILEAIERLSAGGSTNGAMGIHLAYDIAKANFIPGGVNRVILATDGDFNVGTSSEGELVRLIGEKARGGVFLSVLGFGVGNLKDGVLEQIADQGNGHYAYIDSLAEAKKTLVEQAGGTLVTIAKDVKIQVEFNPAQVAAYRLIGYENRLLAKEDFNNDKVDAGEIGAGHTVTALYEIVPVGAVWSAETPAVDELKYRKTESREPATVASDELLTVKIRYKEPAGDSSRKLEFALRDGGARFEEASQDFKFAAAVAAFGMALRDSPHKGSLTLAEVAAWGRAGIGNDAGGYRSEFLGLVDKARALQ